MAGIVVGRRSPVLGTHGMVQCAPDSSARAVPTRVAIGSATAFFVAQMVDVFVFDRLREGSWWRAPLASTLVGSTIDTALFFTIAFSAGMTGLLGTDHNIDFFNEVVAAPFGGSDTVRWVGTAFVDWSVKIGIALIALIPFRMLVRKWQHAPA